MTRGFCPGHVTGFFAIHDQAPDVMDRGSRGAGVSLSRGVESTVSVKRGSEGVHVTLDGHPTQPLTTMSAVNRVLRGERFAVRVESEVQLPVSQGFGMSAAGALSSALALAKELGRDPQEALEAAHAAEIENRTGLGDVAGAWTGGLEVRVRSGCPPRGDVRPLERPVHEPAVVLCIVEGPLETKRVLVDLEARNRINEAGERLVERLLASPTAATMMALSKKFAFDTGLTTARLREAITAAEAVAPASQAMLGNSVFALCPPDRTHAMERVLEPFGRTVVCAVAWDGPRTL